jgi:hypothetical protein
LCHIARRHPDERGPKEVKSGHFAPKRHTAILLGTEQRQVKRRHQRVDCRSGPNLSAFGRRGSAGAQLWSVGVTAGNGTQRLQWRRLGKRKKGADTACGSSSEMFRPRHIAPAAPQLTGPPSRLPVSTAAPSPHAKSRRIPARHYTSIRRRAATSEATAPAGRAALGLQSKCFCATSHGGIQMNASKRR